VKLTRVAANEKGYTFDFDPKRMPHLRAFENQENTGLETVEVFTYWQVDLPDDGSVLPVLRFRPAAGTNAAAAPADRGPAPAAATADPAITVHGWATARSCSAPRPPTRSGRRSPPTSPTSPWCTS
jgi:hypothetical protein